MTRRYWIRLRGHDGHEVWADNAAKAKAADFRAWCEAGMAQRHSHNLDSPFKQYLSQIEAVHALGELDGDPRTPQYGVAP